MKNNQNGQNREMNTQPNETQGGDEKYVAPAIQTYSSEEFLEVLGPAQGYLGTSPNSGRIGWGQRLFPGSR